MTLLKAPTGTLLFNYKDIKQEIVHKLLLEEYGVSKKWVIIMDRKQDLMWLRLQQEKVDLRLRTVTVPEVLEEARRNGVQTKRNRNKSSICDSYVTGVGWPTLFLINCFGIEIVLCDLYLKRFDLTKGLLFTTFVITIWYKLCRCDHSVLEFRSFSLLKNW